MYRGMGVSPGIAIGKALVWKSEPIVVESRRIEDEEEEWKRFQEAVKKTKKQLKEIQKTTGEAQQEILETHLMISEDPELLERVWETIFSEKINAEAAFEKVVCSFVSLFEAMEQEYMRERAIDIRDVSERILMSLMEIESMGLGQILEPVILVVHDLKPSQTVQLDREKVLGFVTAMGSKTSHSAIMAKAMEIPAVVGLKDITHRIKNGDMLLLDGEEGLVIPNPALWQIAPYQEKREKENLKQEELRAFIHQTTISRDGRKIALGCNIGSPKDVQRALEKGAEGIGLYRTEFLYMDRTSLPSEEEQYEAYRMVLEKMDKHPVIIRTLDIGGDKELPYMGLPQEANPFLGYRAIRISLDRREIFKTQLRALLRASIHGSLKIMYPMISSVEEVREAKEILEEAKEALKAEGREYGDDIEIGIMIETPAAAILSDVLSNEVDFFSIGTNDLTQYVIAVDRMNEKIAHLYNPFHPAVLRLIQRVIENAHQAGRWVGICGEMAGDRRFIPIFLGMGVDELSMSHGLLLHARNQISKLSYEEMRGHTQQILRMVTGSEIESFVMEHMVKK